MERRNDNAEEAEISIERFARRTIELGFEGGQEKVISYDQRTDTVECETQFRKYLETRRDAPKNGKLSEATKKRNVFTVVNKESLVYKRFVDMEELFLVSWDSGKSIKIMDYDKMQETLDIAASQKEEVIENIPNKKLPENTRESVEENNEESNSSEEEDEKRFDTDIPEPTSE